MLDGVSYPDIIERLASRENTSSPITLQWKKRGHKDWLVQQDWWPSARPAGNPQPTSSRMRHTQVNQSPCTLHSLRLRCPGARFSAPVSHRPTKLGGDSRPRSDPSTPVPASREPFQVRNTRRKPAPKAQARDQNSPRPQRKLPIRNAAPLVRMVGDISASLPGRPVLRTFSKRMQLHRRATSSLPRRPHPPPRHPMTPTLSTAR